MFKIPDTDVSLETEVSTSYYYVESLRWVLILDQSKISLS